MRISLTAALAAGSILTAATLPALAQSPFVLDEVVFSASRLPVTQGSLGSSVTVIERDALAASGDIQLSSALGRLPGVGVVQLGPLGSIADVRIRGAHQRHVSVLVDGIPINDPSSTQGAFDFGGLVTSDVGRVEVLRGSQSAGFGGSAVGGVVSLTTRVPDHRPGFSQTLDLEVGRYATRRLTYGLGVSDERGFVGLNLSHVATDGFSAADVNDGAREADGFELNRLSLRGQYRISDAVTLGVAGFLQRSRNEYDGGFPLGDRDNVQRRRDGGARVFAEIEGAQVTHTLALFAHRVRRSDRTEGQALPALRRGDRLGASYTGALELTPGLDLAFGLDAERERARGPDFGPLTEDRTGVFVDALWAVRDDLDLSAAARHDRHDAFGNFTTGRLGLAWRPTQDVVLRGAVSDGYRVPVFAERFSAFGNPDLQAERSRSAEIGAAWAPGGGMSVAATLFWLQTDDDITFDFATFLNENIEQTRRRGIEIAATAPLGDRVGLGLAYTFVDAQITGGPFSGDRLGRVPRNEVALSLDAEITPRLEASARLVHASGRLDRNGAVPLPSYTVVDAGVRFKLNEAVDLTARIDNLLDRQYQLVQGYGTSDRALHVGLASRF